MAVNQLGINPGELAYLIRVTREEDGLDTDMCLITCSSIGEMNKFREQISRANPDNIYTFTWIGQNHG